MNTKNRPANGNPLVYFEVPSAEFVFISWEFFSLHRTKSQPWACSSQQNHCRFFLRTTEQPQNNLTSLPNQLCTSGNGHVKMSVVYFLSKPYDVMLLSCIRIFELLKEVAGEFLSSKRECCGNLKC